MLSLGKGACAKKIYASWDGVATESAEACKVHSDRLRVKGFFSITDAMISPT